MRRRFFTYLAVLSFVLCVATAALWVRSCFRHDTWFVEHRQVSGEYWKSRRTLIHSVGGRLVCAEEDERHLPLTSAPPSRTSTVRSMRIEPLSWSDEPSKGVQWRSSRDLALPVIQGSRSQLGGGIATNLLERTRWTITYAAAIFTLAMLPLGWVVVQIGQGRLRRRRTREGLCPLCGYDLRATPGRCPECGAGTAAGVAR